MFIKYKGKTSIMLTALSHELGVAVDLKTSEIIIKRFFQKSMSKLTLEEKMLLVSQLPCHLKPFAYPGNNATEIEHALFLPEKMKSTLNAIFRVLEKHSTEQCFNQMLSCFPDNPSKDIFLHKKRILAA